MRARMSREFYLPREFTDKITREGIEAEVYLVDGSRGPVAYGFGGKRSKPDFQFRFRDEEKRKEYIDDYFDRLGDRLKEKAERAALKRNFKHSLEVGSILYSSWGYDQTNIDYYEVVKLVGKKSVMIAPIGSAYVEVEGSGPSADYVVAVPGSFDKDEEPSLKRVQEGNIVRVNSVANAYPWDGEPKYKTAWGYGH